MKRSREPEEQPSDPETAASPGSNGLNALKSEEAASPASKITELDPSETDSGVEMRCSLPPHKEPLVFSTYEEYETHYRKTHTNRCLECHKNFPSAHLLNLHIEETHDAFATVRRERGDHTVRNRRPPLPPFPPEYHHLANNPRQYSCFVEGCERQCSTPQKRRMHLIDKHMYPKNFFFAVTRDGIDGRRSLLLEGGHRRRRSSVATTTSLAKPPHGRGPAGTETTDGSTEHPQAEETGGQSPKQVPDAEMDDLAGAMSSLQFVPPSIRFGRGGRKAGFSKR
jgi:hypothetical protein